MAPIKNIKGQKFNHLTAIEHRGRGYWLFRCDCGNEVVRYQGDVVRGSRKSCGCMQHAIRENLVGKRFGRLIVLEYAGEKKWKCQCDCGETTVADGDSLRSGNKRSCGCLQTEMYKRAKCVKHGESNSPTYIRWLSMKRRCYYPKNVGYPNYGGRGIKVCDRWLGEHGFENFLVDMGEAPSREYSLDRIDVNGDYTPENCRWATWKEQSNNKRTNRKFTHNGRTHTVTEWCEELGLNLHGVFSRIHRGLTKFEDVFGLHNNHLKRVNLYNENGEFVRTYPSIKATAADLGVSIDMVSDRCKHRHPNVGKYRFEFA